MHRGRWLAIAAVSALAAACAGSTAEPAAAPAQPVVAEAGHLTMTARNVALTPAVITSVPQDLTIEYDNQDGGIPHDLVLYAGDVKLAASAIITGPATTTLTVAKLVPGAYRFTCTVHPNMTASLTVEGG